VKQGIESEEGIEAVRRVAFSMGMEMTHDQAERLEKFVALLLSWNTKVNLISRSDTSNIWPKHVLHSLSLLWTVEIPQGLRVVDIGTGGGFPGVPLAIIRPDIHVVLVDSIRKKCAALGSIVHELAVRNVSVVNSRVEDLAGSPGFRESFDLTVSRGVGPLSRLIAWSIPLLKRPAVVRTDGLPWIIAFKGGDLSSEISQARREFPDFSIHEHDIQTGPPEANALEGKKILIVKP
jgi:16S rRNA (guanine527-N7)-methyltransferase